jgi:hypothetical protein
MSDLIQDFEKENMPQDKGSMVGKIATFLGIPLATVAACLLMIGQYRERVDSLDAVIKTELVSKAAHIAEYQDSKMKLMLLDSRVTYLAGTIDNLSTWKNTTSEQLATIKSDLSQQRQILVEIRDDLRTIKKPPL